MPSTISCWMIKLYWPKHDLDADFWQLFCLVRKAKGSSVISLIPDDHRPVLVHNSSLAWSLGPLLWDSQPLFLIRQFSESCSLLLTSSDNDFSFCCLLHRPRNHHSMWYHHTMWYQRIKARWICKALDEVKSILTFTLRYYDRNSLLLFNMWPLETLKIKGSGLQFWFQSWVE